jgi:hypothetical protein
MVVDETGGPGLGHVKRLNETASVNEPYEDLLHDLIAGHVGENDVKLAAQSVHAGLGPKIGLLLLDNELP